MSDTWKSHPMWVRGLKLELLAVVGDASFVAPYVGAWIETPRHTRLHDTRSVAPYVGAWIETCGMRGDTLTIESHPMWVRGLKPPTRQEEAARYLSHPMWVRGLKPLRDCIPPRAGRSHPMWVRGLKPEETIQSERLRGVAPYVGAWIET